MQMYKQQKSQMATGPAGLTFPLSGLPVNLSYAVRFSIGTSPLSALLDPMSLSYNLLTFSPCEANVKIVATMSTQNLRPHSV